MALITLQDLQRRFGANLPSIAGGIGRQRQEVIDPLEPTDQAIQDEVTAQEEDEEGLLFKILDLPSKALGFYSATGFLEGVARGDIEDAMKQFVQGSPFAFAAQGIVDLVTDDVDEFTVKKRFRDVRIAAGSTDVDMGVQNAVINIVGDVLLDPSTWLNPFGSVRKVTRNAAKVNKIAHKAAASSSARGKRFMQEAADQVEAGTLKGLVATTVNDADSVREAVTFAERVRTGASGLLLFRVPFMESSEQIVRVLPRNWENRVAGGLTRTSQALSQMPVVGPLLQKVNPLSAITDPVQRAAVKAAMESGQSMNSALQAELVTQLQHLQESMPEQVAQSPELQRVMLNMIELDDMATLDTALDRYRAMAEANSFGRNQLRQRFFARQTADKTDFPGLWQTASRGTGQARDDAIRTLYDRGFPLSDRQLQHATDQGLTVTRGGEVVPIEARPGIELYDETLSETFRARMFGDVAEEGSDIAGLPQSELARATATEAPRSYGRWQLPPGAESTNQLYQVDSNRLFGLLQRSGVNTEVSEEALARAQARLESGADIVAPRLRFTGEAGQDIRVALDSEEDLALLKALAASDAADASRLQMGTIVYVDDMDAATRGMATRVLQPRNQSDIVNHLAPWQRTRDLEAFEEALDQGLDFNGVQAYLDQYRAILLKMREAEEAAHITNTYLEPYFPRVMSNEARALVDRIAPRRLKGMMTDSDYQVFEGFMAGRKFTDLSTAEVNLVMGRLGTTRTSGNIGLETFYDVLMEDPAFRRQLIDTDPDAFEFFATDLNHVLFQRAQRSISALTKKNMTDMLFHPAGGIVTATTTVAEAQQNRMWSQGLWQNQHTGEVSRYRPFKITSGAGGAGFQGLEPGQAAAESFTWGLNEHAKVLRSQWDEELVRLRDAAGVEGNDVLASLQDARKFDGADHLVMDETVPIWKRQKKQTWTNRQQARVKRDEMRQYLPTSRRQRQLVGDEPAAVRGQGPRLTAQLRLDGDTVERVNWNTTLFPELDDIATSTEARVAAATTPQAAREALEAGNREALLAIKERTEGYEILANQMDAKYRGLNAALDETISDFKGSRSNNVSSISMARADADKVGQELRQTLGDPASFDRAFRQVGAQGDEWGMRVFDDLDEAARNLTPEDTLHWVPEEVADQVSHYVKAISGPDHWRRVMEPLDRITRWWKRNTVLYFPQSRIRDYISNFSMLMMGGFRDPTTVGPTFNLWRLGSRFSSGKISHHQYLSELKAMTIEVGGGRQMTGEQFLSHFRRNGLEDTGALLDELQQTSADLVDAGYSRRVVGRARDVMARGELPFPRLPREHRYSSAQELATQVTEEIRNGTSVVGKAGRFLDLDTLVRPDNRVSSPLVKFGIEVARFGDNHAKMAGYLDALRRGMDPVEAGLHIKQFTYTPGSHAMSNVEKYGLRRAIPFYNWMRFSTTLMAEQFLTNPKAFASLGKIHADMEMATGVGDVPEDLIASQYAQERLNIPVHMTARGPVYLMLDGYLPHSELPALAEAVAGLLPGSGTSAQETLDYFGERLTPAVKTALEQALNYEFYHQRAIQQYEGEQTEIFGVPVSKRTAHGLSALRFLKTVDSLNLINLEEFRIAVGAVERGSQGTTRAEAGDRLGTGLASVLGAPRTITPDLQREADYRQLQLEVEASKLKSLARRRGEDARPAKQEEVEQLTGLLAEKRASLQRLERFREKLGLDPFERRSR